MKNNKKAVSIMIGYVLLVVGVIVLSAVVYVWLKSYLPRETIECPEGVSLFIEENVCKEINGIYELNISIRNNGRFDIDGYYIKSGVSGQEIATEDISENITYGGYSPKDTGIVLFSGGKLKTDEKVEHRYSIGEIISLIEIIPIRYEVIEGKNRLVSCGNKKIRQIIECD